MPQIDYKVMQQLAKDGDMKALLRLAEDKTSPVYQVGVLNESVFTYLARADLRGKEEAVGRFIDALSENGFDINQARSRNYGGAYNNVHPLFDAYEQLNAPLVKVLLEHGAQLQVERGYDLFGSLLWKLDEERYGKKTPQEKENIYTILNLFMDSGQVDFIGNLVTSEGSYSYLNLAERVGLPKELCERIATGVVENITAKYPEAVQASPVVQAGGTVAGQLSNVSHNR